MLLSDAVVSARQPRLEVREDPVDAWEERSGSLAGSLCLALVDIALVGERTVAAPAVGMHEASGGHRLFEKPDQRRRGHIIDDAEPDSAGTAATNLNRCDDDRFCASTQSSSSSALLKASNIGLVDLDLS